MEYITQITAGKRSATLDRTRAYMGSTLSFLIQSEETSGRINFVEGQGKAGNEPPPHYHEWENEIYYILEGVLEFFCEGVTGSTMVGANEMMVIPKGKVHAFYAHSPRFRTIIITQATGEQPVGLDIYFTAMSEPAKTMNLDANQATYAESDPQAIVELAARYGTIFISPEEAKRKLPDYPGFGVNIQTFEAPEKEYRPVVG